jgi:excisionase family DNA binding protein
VTVAGEAGPSSERGVARLLRGYPEVMTAEEVAEVLRFTPQGIRTKAAKGEIPGRKIGREWRFLREDIAALLGLTLPREASEESGPPPATGTSPGGEADNPGTAPLN